MGDRKYLKEGGFKLFYEPIYEPLDSTPIYNDNEMIMVSVFPLIY